MKGGRVVRIRVNPQDALGVADIIGVLGLDCKLLTFDQAVRIALSSLLESARVHNSIPRADGFEYGSVMAKFITKPGELGKKREVGELLNKESVRIAPAINDPATKRRRVRYEELKFKWEHDKENWTDALQEEFRPLVDEFF